MSISNSYYSLLRVFSVFFIYFARIITIGYSIKTLILIGRNSTLISLSNYKYKEEIYHLLPEIIPTFFLSIFVVFFPPLYLLYTNIEEIYLSLPLSKWDFFIIFIGGFLLIINLIIKPRSFGYVFSWRSNHVLTFTSIIKNLIKFIQGFFLERLILKKKVKGLLLLELSNKEDCFGYYYLKTPLVFFNKRMNSFFFVGLVFSFIILFL